MSSDGLTVVGENSQQATRWQSPATEAEALGNLFELPVNETLHNTHPADVSVAGDVAVGWATQKQTWPWTDRAFIWTEATGMRPLRRVLIDLGVNMTGWQLTRAHAISADGRVIAGEGVNPQGVTEAWRAVVPNVPPPRLPALAPSGIVLLALSLIAAPRLLAPRR